MQLLLRPNRSGINDRGSVFSVVLFAILVVGILILVPFFVFGRSVPPNYIGVRQNYFDLFFFLGKGYQSEGLPPGRHWQVPGISSVFLLPRDFRYIDYQGDSANSTFPELEIPTTDGSKVKTAVTLAVRLHEKRSEASNVESDGMTLLPKQGGLVEVPVATALNIAHGGPKDLVLEYTSDEGNVLRSISRKGENFLKRELSQLSTSEYYNPVLRERAAIKAQHSIEQDLAADGIEVYAALIQRYVYAEKTIDDQIFAKNLQDQTERMNAAASRLAAAKAETEKQRALWDAKIRDLQVEGESRVNVTESEGRLYSAKKRAEGDLLVAKSQADVDRARAELLAQSQGADVYLGREIAPLLQTLQGGIVTDIDPYNIDKWVEKLTGGRP